MEELNCGYIASIIKKKMRKPSSIRNSKPCDVYNGLAKLHWAKNHVPVIFKIFLPSFQSSAIFNEIFFHRLAKAISLPVPKDACICPCNKNKFIGPSRCLEGRDTSSEFVNGVASVHANPNGNNVVQLMSRNSVLAEQELFSWPHLPEVAVFDELIINIDRTQNNIYRLGDGKFMLIDHAEALGGQGWSINQLQRRIKESSRNNIIASSIAEAQISSLEQQMMRKAVDWSREYAITEELLEIEGDKLDALCQLETGTTKKVIALLNYRMKLLPKLLFYYLQQAQFNFHQ